MKLILIRLRLYLLFVLSVTASIANGAIVEPEAGVALSSNQFEVSWEPGAREFWVRVIDESSNQKLYDSGRLGSGVTSHTVTVPESVERLSLSLYEKVAGRWSQQAQVHTLSIDPLPDNEPDDGSDNVPNEGPAAVANLTLSVYSPSTIEVQWDRSVAGSFVVAYELSLDGSVVDTVDALSYVLRLLQPEQRYQFSVVAIDGEGLRSSPATIDLGTSPGNEPPTQPPTGDGQPLPPGNLRIDVYSGSSAEVLWDRSTGDVVVTGYEVSVNGAVIGVFDALSYYSSEWTAGQAYAIKLVAIGNNQQRSAPVSVDFIGGQREGSSQISKDNYRQFLDSGLRLVLKTFSAGRVRFSDASGEYVDLQSQFEEQSGGIPAGAGENDAEDDFENGGYLPEFDFTRNCQDGGSVNLAGYDEVGVFEENYTFDQCQIGVSVAQGTISRYIYLFGAADQFTNRDDIRLEQVPTVYGTGNIELKVFSNDGDCFLCTSRVHEIENYIESAGARSLTVSGTSGFFNLFTMEPYRGYYNANLSMGVRDLDSGVNATLLLEAEQFGFGTREPDSNLIDDLVPLEGFLNLTAGDGSRVSVSPADTVGLVNVYLLTGNGDETNETLSWDELRP